MFIPFSEAQFNCSHGCTVEEYKLFQSHVSAINEFSSRISFASSATYNVPVTFTWFRDSDGNGNVPGGNLISQTAIDDAINDLNTAFAEMNLNFFQSGETNYIDNTSLHNDLYPLKNFYYTSTSINVLIRNTGASNATLPTWNPDNSSWIELRRPSSLATVLLHEMGHYFGLLHTFGGQALYNNPANPNPTIPTGNLDDHPYLSDFPRELVIRENTTGKNFNEKNWDIAGDLIGDTPATCIPGTQSSVFFPDLTDPDCSIFPFIGCSSGCDYDISDCEYTGNYVDYNNDPISPPPPRRFINQ